MAAYCRVYDSRHLQADCQEPGSAPEPYALYGLPVPFMGYISALTLLLLLLLLLLLVLLHDVSPEKTHDNVLVRTNTTNRVTIIQCSRNRKASVWCLSVHPPVSLSVPLAYTRRNSPGGSTEAASIRFGPANPANTCFTYLRIFHCTFARVQFTVFRMPRQSQSCVPRIRHD